MGIYVATFNAKTVSAAEDLFTILAGTGVNVVLRRIALGQFSKFGDANADILGITIVRGNTVAGTGGAAASPIPIFSGGQDAKSTVRANDTTAASGGSPVTLWSDVWNIMAAFVFPPPTPPGPPAGPSGYTTGYAGLITAAPGERLVVRQTAPAAGIDMNGTIEFEEIDRKGTW